MLRWIGRIFVLALLAALLAGGWWYYHQPATATVSYRTYALKRGELVATISATGTIEPEELLDVGAQVAGQINTLGKDAAGRSIDYGSVVEEGMVLANIDDVLYVADVASATAQVEQAKAGVVHADADLALSKAKLDQAQRDWDRAKKLG
ncbi:MAG: RND transporter, partial [Tepidisphaeraceae bacterium]